MSKIIQALLSGVFFTFLLDFTVFLGIFLNYIKFLEIDIYFNILFADNQNIYIFAFFTLLIGYLITYLNNTKITMIVIGLFFITAILTLIPSVGYSLGEKILMKKNITYKNTKHTFIGDVYYDGRKAITFYDYELKKTILLKKKDLK